MPPVASALQACRPTRPDFPVTTRTPDPPIIRGPAKNVTLLATALRSATASVREFVRRHTPFLLCPPPASSHIGPMPVETYLSLALREFARLRQIADRAIAQLPPGTFTTPPAPGDNSVAAIVKHVGGNLLSRWTDFLTTDGEKPGRDRDTEFVILPTDTPENLLNRWAQGWAALFTALTPLTAADLDRTITIRGEPLTVLQAVQRQLTHYAYHVGQIVFIAKHFAGPRWQSLSIAPGQSAAFNRAPTKYLEKS
jgi:hypothetical protein